MATIPVDRGILLASAGAVENISSGDADGTMILTDINTFQAESLIYTVAGGGIESIGTTVATSQSIAAQPSVQYWALS